MDGDERGGDYLQLRGAGLALVVAVIGSLALSTASTATVWSANTRLWTVAVAQSPRKPRPAVNLAAADIAAGDYDRAARELDRAEWLGQQRTGWERRHTADLVRANRAVLALKLGHRQQACQFLAQASAEQAVSGALARQWCHD